MPRIGAAAAGTHRQPVREAVDAVRRKRHRRLQAAADVQHAHVVSVRERIPCQIVVPATCLPIRDHRLLVTAVAAPSVHGGSQRQAGTGNRLVRKSLKRRIFDVAAQVGRHRTRSEHALPQTQRAALHFATRSMTIGISRRATGETSFNHRHQRGRRLISSRDPISRFMYDREHGSQFANCGYVSASTMRFPPSTGLLPFIIFNASSESST